MILRYRIQSFGRLVNHLRDMSRQFPAGSWNPSSFWCAPPGICAYSFWQFLLARTGLGAYDDARDRACRSLARSFPCSFPCSAPRSLPRRASLLPCPPWFWWERPLCVFCVFCVFCPPGDTRTGCWERTDDWRLRCGCGDAAGRSVGAVGWRGWLEGVEDAVGREPDLPAGCRCDCPAWRASTPSVDPVAPVVRPSRVSPAVALFRPADDCAADGLSSLFCATACGR